MSDESWGFGSTKWEPFSSTVVDGQPAELAYGEHPHMRQDQTVYARVGERIVGFSGHRLLVRVEVGEENYLKESRLSGCEVRGTCTGRVYAGEFLVLHVRKHDAVSTMVEIASRLPGLFEGEPVLWTQEGRAGIAGRRIYWHGEPAVIESFDGDLLEVTLRAETESGFFRPAPQHDDQDPQDRIRDGIYSPGIWWWREEST